MELVLILVLGGAVAYLVRARRNGAVLADAGWEVGVAPSAVVPPAGPVDVAAEPASARVPLALARVEGWRLLASPLTIVGALLMLVLAVTYLDGSSTPEETEWIGLVMSRLPLAVFPYCGMVLLAINRAALRGRRDGAEELFASLPVTRATRSTGHLFSLWTVLLLGSGLLLAVFWSMLAGSGKADDGTLFSYVRTEEALPASATLAYLLAALVLIACAGALGLAAARLVPYSIAGIVALVVVGLWTGGGGAGDATDAVRSLLPYTNTRALPDLLSAARPWPHVLYLVGLGLVAVGATWLLDGARRQGAITLGVAVAVAVVGWTIPVVLPDDARIATVAAVVSSPLDHQVCTEEATATYCAYEPFERFTDDWAAAIQPVLDAVPPGIVTGPLRVEQRPSPLEIALLDERVRSRLEPATLGRTPHAWTSDDAIHPDLRWSGEESAVTLAINAGSWAVGLPAAPSDESPCYVGGQARGVVALWLAARSTGVEQADEWYRTPDEMYGVNDYGTRPQDMLGEQRRYNDLLPNDWSTNAGATLVWDVTDLALARTLLAEPTAEVQDVLHREWDVVTDPETTTTDLAVLFGLEGKDAGAGPADVPRCA